MARKPSARSSTSKTTSAKQTDAARDGNRWGSGNAQAQVTPDQLNELLTALRAARDGDFSVRMSRRAGILGEISRTFNELVEMNATRTKDFTRVARVIGREGRMHERMGRPVRGGQWAVGIDSVNSLIDDLVRPTTEVARVMEAVAQGDLSHKMALKIEGQPVKGEFLRIGTAVNSMVDQLSSFAAEVTRVAREVGTEGKLGGQARVRGVSGTWKDLTDSVNFMAGNLTAQVRDIAQVTTAVARGDLSQKITVDVKGEILELKNTINTMVDQLSSFADEVTRVAREVGTEGKLGGQAQVRGVSGTWKDLTDNVNFMAGNLTSQVRNIAQVATAVANGDLSRKITVEAKGEVAALADTINSMTDTLQAFADEVTRVAREVGTEGNLGGQARVEGVAGTWKDLTDNVNFMAGNLTSQVRNIAQVATAVANGDLSRKITVEAKGEVAALADTINSMTDTLRAFADEVTRVAREVGTEGNLGGQAKVEGVAGTWKDLTDSVNFMAGNLTAQVRDIAQVTTAVARGDLSQKITVDVKGEIFELKNTINVMVDQLSSFADEVTRVAREVGTEGKLGGQARVEGVSGTWKGLTQNVNFMASNLTDQVRNIAQVATAVATGDLSKKITVDAQGEILELKDTINTMVDQLSSFADEVTRVAREVGTEGKLGGQARVEGVSGTWQDLTDNVNFMATNLTDQVRNIAQVTTAVANGDLSQKITVDVKGEILELKDTINTMVDQLSSFADEVTRVAREVGTEGKLGGQARVEGASGTWKNLTENVNQLAGNLTTQVRAIADVATAVTQGDLTREITVAAHGEVAQLKDKINQMITNLAETTQRNEEQDWLKTNLAKISGMMQGQRDLQTVSRLIMSELTPTVSSQHGAFFLAEPPKGDGGTAREDDVVLKLKASYGYRARKNVANEFKLGEGLVGQAALEKKPILISEAPEDYIKISSGLGEAAPVNIIVVPVIFEDQVLGVIELGSLRPFSGINQTFLDQLMETLGVVLNTIKANMRTEELLEESQRLTRELQSQSEELQTQQEELQQTNEELQEKAALLAEQNRNIEIKNQEIELARSSLEEKAQQLALSSKYKSEFLANMSHELRTPLNSLLILAKLLADNDEHNLTDKQIEFATTIHNAGAELLALINDILDLSKVEAGKMDVHPASVPLSSVADNVEQSFRPVANQKGLEFSVEIAEGAPSTIITDEQRLQQVLNNLLSNAFKFTTQGAVTVRIHRPPEGVGFMEDSLNQVSHVVAFEVSDTGIGVPDEKLRLIFEAFQQADGTTSRRYGGTGLGLSISREISRLLGGEIHVASETGKGSTFTLFLPATYVAARAVPSLPRLELGTPVVIPGEGSGGPQPGESAPLPARTEEPLDLPNDLRDDRMALADGDRTLLVANNDAATARRWMEAARSKQFKTLAAMTSDAAYALTREYQPDAILVDADLGDGDGQVLLNRLKLDTATRHIPVYVAADPDLRPEVMKAGAATCVEKPVTDDALASVLRAATYFIERGVKNLIVIEDDEVERNAIVQLVGTGDDVAVTAVGSSQEALEEMESKHFDCAVLDLKLPDMTGFDLLEKLRNDARFRDLPIIVYTGKDLTRTEETRLRKYSDSIIVKDVNSPERLLAETSLFLHRVASALPTDRRQMIEHLHSADSVFEGKKILVVDDDIRNVFALTSILEAKGMQVIYAENGRDGIETLDQNPDVDLVLMDIMMPEMDGYETTKAIRSQPKFESLPIIALTAKAMKGDREKSISAGASDYVTKPVDPDQLLSLMRVWLYH